MLLKDRIIEKYSRRNNFSIVIEDSVSKDTYVYHSSFEVLANYSALPKL